MEARLSKPTDLLDNPEFTRDLLDESLTGVQIAAKWGCGETTARKWRVRAREGNMPDKPTDTSVPSGESETHNPDGSASYTRFSDVAWGAEDYREFIRSKGQDPDEVTFTWGWTSNPAGGFWNKLNNVRPIASAVVDDWLPAWPVIQPGPAHTIATPKKTSTPLGGQWKTAVLASDTQIGFRELDTGLDPFHDDRAISILLDIVDIERPEQTVLMGDILDLAGQGRWAQEAAFARTTQPAIDRGTRLGAELRGRTPGEIVWIEGNHEKRLQNFVETNAVSAFGLRKGNLPDSWPVMSLPNLLRLDEANIRYMDAYPASHWWVNDRLRCEHGTKANSSGSTAAQYMNDTPHISRAHGHHHRLEVQSKTTYDRMGKIKSVAISPGCLCRVDGAVPSVNGAIGASGKPAEVFENWQQGVVVIRYKDDGEFFWNLVQIEDGRAIYEGQELIATIPALAA